MNVEISIISISKASRRQAMAWILYIGLEKMCRQNEVVYCSHFHFPSKTVKRRKKPTRRHSMKPKIVSFHFCRIVEKMKTLDIWCHLLFYPEENFSDKIPTTETILTPVHNVLFSFIGLISKTFELNKCTSEAKFVVIYVAGGTFEMPN